MLRTTKQNRLGQVGVRGTGALQTEVETPKKLLVVLGTNRTCRILIKAQGFHAPLTHHPYQEAKQQSKLETCREAIETTDDPARTRVRSRLQHLANSITYP